MEKGLEEIMLGPQNNLANNYAKLGRHQDSLRMSRDVYSGNLKLHGEEQEHTLVAANNYAACLMLLKRTEEAKALMRKTMPVAQRVLGDSNDTTLRMGSIYARALFEDAGATLDDLREAVTMLEEPAPIARRVLGSAHPVAAAIESSLRNARAALHSSEAP